MERKTKGKKKASNNKLPRNMKRKRIKGQRSR